MGRKRGPALGWEPDRDKALKEIPKIQRGPRSPLYNTQEWRSFLSKMQTTTKVGWSIEIPLSPETLGLGKTPSSVISSFRQLIARHLHDGKLTKKYDPKVACRRNGERFTLYVRKIYGLPPQKKPQA
jgi:hypothetical protein